MRRVLFCLGLALLSFLGFLQVRCGQSVSPTDPAIVYMPTPTPVTVNSNGPLIEAFFLDINIPTVNVGSYVSVFIVDNVGAPVINAAVTLVTPNGATRAPYLGNNSSNPQANMGIANITGGNYAGAVAYTPGQTCTFNIVIGATTYSRTFTALAALAASGSVAKGSSGVTCTWAAGGNENTVFTTGNDSLQYGPVPSISSPYVIPAADFVSDPAGGGNDVVILELMQVIEPAFTGAQAGSVIGSGSEIGTRY